MENIVMTAPFPGLLPEKELKHSRRGSVWLVRERDSLRRCVYRRFEGSADVYGRMQSINCPCLPKIYKAEEQGGYTHVLEEYVQGDTLFFLLQSGPLKAEQAKNIMQQLCRALSLLHSLGAVHRDIKPENIILRGDCAVLIDFDASRIQKPDSDMDTRIMGTTGYAAPEQYGYSQTDARADIYSLGILFNEMLTGRHPSKKLAEGCFRPVIEKCTQINADRRYSDVWELFEALSACENEKKPRSGKSPGRVFALIAAALVLSLGIFFRHSAEKGSEPALPEISVFRPERVYVSEEAYPGEIVGDNGYATTFSCDMDGDGVEEKYIFGADYIDSPHENIVYHCRSGLIFEGAELTRKLHPCVWRLYGDGSMELAPEFADYLEDVSSTVWRVNDFEARTPQVWTLDYVWPGCINAVFYPERIPGEECSGWMYETRALLNGKELSAGAYLMFSFDN